MGLMDFLSPALTVATTAASAQQGAQRDAQRAQQEDMLRTATIKRQVDQEAIQRTIQERQLRSQEQRDAIAAAVEARNAAKPVEWVPTTQQEYMDVHPKAPIMGSPDWQRAIDFEARTNARYRTSAADHTTDKRSGYILKRIGDLTKSQRNPLSGIPTPGLSIDEATRRAELEWDAARGNAALGQGTPTPLAPPKSSPPTPSSGDIDLRSSGADALATVQGKYKEALRRGIDPQRAQQAYQEDLAAIAREFGLTQ